MEEKEGAALNIDGGFSLECDLFIKGNAVKLRIERLSKSRQHMPLYMANVAAS